MLLSSEVMKLGIVTDKHDENTQSVSLLLLSAVQREQSLTANY